MKREVAKLSRYLVLAIAIVAIPVGLQASGAGFWHTSGGRIVDSNGQRESDFMLMQNKQILRPSTGGC